MIGDEVIELVDLLDGELADLLQVNEIWTDRQRGPVSSLRFRRYHFSQQWSELRDMRINWSNVSEIALRKWLYALRRKLED